MARHQDENPIARRDCRSDPLSRRKFLEGLRWAPLLFLPAPIQASPFRFALPNRSGYPTAPSFPFADARLTPHYPAKSLLEDVLRRVAPGSDEYVTEKYAFEITRLLEGWSAVLKTAPPALAVLGKIVDPSIEGGPLTPAAVKTLRSGPAMEVLHRKFGGSFATGREQFLGEMKRYLAEISRIDTAEFQIVEIKESPSSAQRFRVVIRYDLAGVRTDKAREERIGHWSTEWVRDSSGAWHVTKWASTEETLSRAREPIFVEISKRALGQTDSYKNQLLRGGDYWRTVLDGACGIDVYGNNGLAVGDIDGDGFDDLYVCQPPGLPNRLYRNRGDGTFEDVTEKSGLGVLDGTACALFADFENKGLQDLLLVCGGGPLLFLNQGNGKFSLKRDAFQFLQPPQGTFTHAAVADYDRDGRLDIYFCLYSYYLGLDQYHYPVPYFDARNGPANFLLHNEGNATFQDRTESAGLHVDNDRYSFACAWGDYNSDGAPDLYVANDFGRNNLYRNNGDGTFTVVSSEAGVDDVGAGMSACWFDFENDGNQDIYAADMWSAPGIRVSRQSVFHAKDPENIRALYKQHAGGNALYRNRGNGSFENVSATAGVQMGRWAWCSDAFDFDHDGYSDLYIANGYISGPAALSAENVDLSSFFWRQVVGKSPSVATPATNYEQGWSAINELIRSDSSWNSFERNVLYLNNHDGTFSEVSGVAGLDFPDDSRSFVVADLDHDGRMEVILKNRNAPQIRVLHNVMKEIGNSVAFRLRGTKSNRDAIGAAIIVETGAHRQTKYLQAGSGFLSQHSKDVFFGLSKNEGPVRATIRWPSGLTQSFERLPVNQRIDIEEGSEKYSAQPFASSSTLPLSEETPKLAPLPAQIETWLIEPLSAPDFSLPDLAGNRTDLQSLPGGTLLLNFWISKSQPCIEQLRVFQKNQSTFAKNKVRVAALNVDDPADQQAARSVAAQERLSFPVLLATPEIAGIYNIVSRYLFDRRKDLPLPTSLLLDADRKIVKVYQGELSPTQLIEDANSLPKTAVDRLRRALPFPGTLHLGSFQRNDFTYGVAFFQHGYLDHAAASFKGVIQAKPNEPEAYYNLGTLYLRKSNLPEARQYLEQAVKLNPNYPEAWNNLGMLAAQEGNTEESVRNFRQSLALRPDYVTALVNLGNLYRRQEGYGEAEKLLRHALEIAPDDPETNYSVGMLYARENQVQRATQQMERAVDLRPDYPDALNNLGVLLVRQERYSEAKEKFETCIRVAPNFDQAYLNLARLYVLLKDKDKAREVLQALLRQQPQHKMAQQTLEMLN
jgi:Flp pilus assembly protein TadD/peroxiredoxin